MKPKEEQCAQENVQKSRGSFLSWKSFHKSRNKSLSRDALSGNNNNNNNNVLFRNKQYSSVISLNDKRQITTADKSSQQPDFSQDTGSKHECLVIQRLENKRPHNNIHEDYASRMSRKRVNLNKKPEFTPTIRGSMEERGQNLRPLRHSRQSLKELVKLKNKIKFENLNNHDSGRTAGEFPRENGALKLRSDEVRTSVSELMDTNEKFSNRGSKCHRKLEDITNVSTARRKVLSSEQNIAKLSTVDTPINNRLSLNFDFPSKRASWSASNHDHQRLPAILSALDNGANFPNNGTNSTMNISDKNNLGVFNFDMKLSVFDSKPNKKKEKLSTKRKEVNGIQYSSSSECSSPESIPGKSLYEKRRMKNRSNTSSNIHINCHNRSTSESLNEKPSKPQTPRPKFPSASSLRDLRIYLSMQNLAQKKIDDAEADQQVTVVGSLKDLHFAVGNNAPNKRHSLATANEGTTAIKQNKIAPLSPEIRHRRTRSRPLSAVTANLKLQAAIIPEDVVVNPVTSNNNDCHRPPVKSTSSPLLIQKRASMDLIDVIEEQKLNEVHALHKRTRVESESCDNVFSEDALAKSARPYSVADWESLYLMHANHPAFQQRSMSSISIPTNLNYIDTLLKRNYSESLTPEATRTQWPSYDIDITSEGPLDGSNPLSTDAFWVEAQWDHVTMDSEELPFNAGDVIHVTDKSNGEWWWGCHDNMQGWFPANFVRVLVNQDLLQKSISNASIPVLFVDEIDEDKENIKSKKFHVDETDGRDVIIDQANVKSHSEDWKRNNMRSNVVREIMKSERDFVQHLKNVIEGYLYRCQKRTDMFTDDKISAIFSNIEQIYEFQKQFLTSLERVYSPSAPHTSNIAEAFLENKLNFEMYSTYCNNHPKAIGVLSELLTSYRYINFFETCRLLQGMISISLDGFLLTPVQKICKYPLQLSELLKSTSERDPNYTSVKEALETMTGVARLINERKRQTENVEKIAAWQSRIVNWKGTDILASSNELIKSDLIHMMLVPKGKVKLRMAYLFDHQIILCKRDLLRKDMHYYKHRIPLDGTTTSLLERNNNSDWLTTNSLLGNFSPEAALKIESASDVIAIMFYKTEQDAQRWLKAMQKEREIAQTQEQTPTQTLSCDIKQAIIKSSNNCIKKGDNQIRTLQYRQRVRMQGSNAHARPVLSTRTNFLNNIALKFSAFKRTNFSK